VKEEEEGEERYIEREGKEERKEAEEAFPYLLCRKRPL
jgi:hypothetical protein